MDKKTSKKNTGKKEKRERGFLERKGHSQAFLVFLGVAAGIAVGATVSSLYLYQQAKPNYSQNQPPDKKDNPESRSNLNKGQAAPLAPGVVPSSANHTFSGTVTKIEGNKIFVDYFSCGKGNKTYSVMVTKTTMIVKRDNTQENRASLSNINKNDNVIIQAIEDIDKENNLTAQYIRIMGEINIPPSNTESQNK